MIYEQAIGFVFLTTALIGAILLLRQWRVRWSVGMNREQTIEIGCIGLVCTFAAFILTASVMSSVARQHKNLVALAMVPVGASWLFFGNVLMYGFRRPRNGAGDSSG